LVETSVRDLLVHVLLGLTLLGGFWLLSQILAPIMGITGYVLSMIIFMVIGYYLNGMVGSRLSGSARAPSSIPYAHAYSPLQRTYSPGPQHVQAPNPPQVATQTRRRYTPEQVRGMLRDIVIRYNAGQLDRPSFERLLTDHVFADAYGRWWTIDVSIGKWVQNKDGKWVEAEPPPWLEK
jgi:hypothetical protein